MTDRERIELLIKAMRKHGFNVAFAKKPGPGTWMEQEVKFPAAYRTKKLRAALKEAGWKPQGRGMMPAEDGVYYFQRASIMGCLDSKTKRMEFC